MKRYNEFIKESNDFVTGTTDVESIKLNDDDVEMFNSEPALQKLISDRKVSLLPPELWYTKGDEDTIKTLKSYFSSEFNLGEETENYMMDEAKTFGGNSMKLKKKNDLRNVDELKAEKKLMMNELSDISKQIKKLEKEHDSLVKEIHKIDDRIDDKKKEK